MNKIKIKESELIGLVQKVILREWNEYGERRPGSIGSHVGGESSLSSISQTNDLNIKDLGIATPEKREQWKSIGRKPNVEYYPDKDPIKMSAHMRHLKRLYGSKIEFFSYNNGNYIFFKLDGKAGYLQPNNPTSEYK